MNTSTQPGARGNIGGFSLDRGDLRTSCPTETQSRGWAWAIPSALSSKELWNFGLDSRHNFCEKIGSTFHPHFCILQEWLDVFLFVINSQIDRCSSNPIFPLGVAHAYNPITIHDIPIIIPVQALLAILILIFPLYIPIPRR